MAFLNLLRGGRKREQELARQLREQGRAIETLEREKLELRRQVKGLDTVARHVMTRYRGGYMLAPPELCLHVGRVDHAANYWKQGLDSSEKVLEVFGEDPGGLVLDWGCGVGRTLHWLRDRGTWAANYRGCDVDPEAIEWLRSQGFDNVSVCQEMPPLPYDASSFMGLFCFSVLTHIPPERHDAWIREIHRVLAPGGRAYLTVHGDANLANTRTFTEEERQHYLEKGWMFSERDGHHKHAALVSEAFTRSLLEELFEIERYTIGGYHAMDEILVRKRA